MLGTLVDAFTILLCGAVGAVSPPVISPRRQNLLKNLLAAFTLYVGLAAAVLSLHGSLARMVGELAVAAIALIAGNRIGKACHLQARFNRLGRFAHDSFSKRRRPFFGEGFLSCSIAYCAAPMALFGPLLEGFSGNSQLLLIKAALDGLAALAFAKRFGWESFPAVIPLLVYQGALTEGSAAVQPFLMDHVLLDSVTLVVGLLSACLSLVMLDIRKVPTADYLPSILIAPALTWLVRL